MIQKSNEVLSKVLKDAGAGCLLVYLHLLNYSDDTGIIVLDRKKREEISVLSGTAYTDISRRLGKLCEYGFLQKIEWNKYKAI